MYSQYRKNEVWIRHCIELVWSDAAKSGFAGYDPYDALNSPLLSWATSRSKYGRIAATQLLKRFPWNLRSLLFVQPGVNPKGLGLFLGGACRLANLEPQGMWLSGVCQLLDKLKGLRCVGFSGNCWGYNFDWQSRTVYRPRGTPTIVNTSFIGHSLLDCYELCGVQEALDLALPIAQFIVNDLNRTVDGSSTCLSYTPVDYEVVHNANLLGASLLIRLFQFSRDSTLEELALSCAGYSVDRQRADGSWFYADTSIQGWIDSFHTGFNLEAIRWFVRLGYDQFKNAYDRGLHFYVSSFFGDDGWPKYYPNRLFPVDIHSPCEAVYLLSDEGENHRGLADLILDWMMKHMYDGNGGFYFQKHRWFTNRTRYMRWSQAWAFRALTEYLHTSFAGLGTSNEHSHNLGCTLKGLSK